MISPCKTDGMIQDGREEHGKGDSDDIGNHRRDMCSGVARLEDKPHAVMR